jgi:hypothetical protein
VRKLESAPTAPTAFVAGGLPLSAIGDRDAHRCTPLRRDATPWTSNANVSNAGVTSRGGPNGIGANLQNPSARYHRAIECGRTGPSAVLSVSRRSSLPCRKALPYRVTSDVPKIRRGGYVFIARKSDHPPRHVHVYRNGRLIVKWISKTKGR